MTLDEKLLEIQNRKVTVIANHTGNDIEIQIVADTRTEDQLIAALKEAIKQRDELAETGELAVEDWYCNGGLEKDNAKLLKILESSA